jgi:predicted MFS family arabinose efflux permease
MLRTTEISRPSLTGAASMTLRSARFGPGRAVRLAMGTAAALGLARFSYGLLVPAMRTELGWTLTQAGVQTTANGLGYLAGALAATPLDRRIGAATAFRLGMLLIVASLAASAVSGDFVFLLVMRAISGLAGALVFITGGVTAAQVAGRAGSSTPITIYFSGAGMAVALCGAGLPPLLSHHAARWPLAWTALAATAVVATAISWTAVNGVPDVVEHPARTRTDLRAARRLWRLAIIYFLFGLGYIAYITFLSAYLTSHHASVWQIACTWALLGMAAVVAPAVWSRPVTVWPGARALCVLLALLAAAAAVTRAEPAAPAVIGSAVVYGISFLSVPAAVTALLRDAVPPTGWTRALAIFTVIFAIGQTGGPYLSGALADRYGTGVTLVWTAVLCGLAAVIAATVRVKSPQLAAGPAAREMGGRQASRSRHSYRVGNGHDAGVNEVAADHGGGVDDLLDACLPETFDGGSGQPVGNVLDLAAQGTSGLSESAIPVDEPPGLEPVRGLLPVVVAPAPAGLNDVPRDRTGSHERQRGIEAAQPGADGG